MGIDVQFYRIATWNAYSRLVPELAAAGTLDVVEAPIGLMVKAWARFGYLQPLNPLIPLTGRLVGDIFPGAIEASRAFGSLFGLPYVASTGESLLIYNPELFDAANIAHPNAGWYLDDLVNAALALNRLDAVKQLSQYGFLPELELPGALTWLELFGIELLNRIPGKAASAEELMALFSWFENIQREHRVFARPIDIPGTPVELLTENTAAMVQASLGTQVSLSSLRRYPAILLPRYSSKGNYGVYIKGLAYCLAKSSPRPSLSLEWCRYMSSAENGIGMLHEGCILPGSRLGSWKDATVNQDFPISIISASLALEYPPEPVPMNLRQQEIYDTWQAITQPFWQGQMTAEECAAVLASAMQVVLDKPSLVAPDFM
jgi:ABC-type glycerol-3-phosphate transport system substrate-binding protein